MRIVTTEQADPINAGAGTFVTLEGTDDEMRSDAAAKLAGCQVDHDVYRVNRGGIVNYAAGRDDVPAGTYRRTFHFER